MGIRKSPPNLSGQQIRLGQIEHLVAAAVHHGAEKPEAEAFDLLRRNRRSLQYYIIRLGEALQRLGTGFG
jgi:hypothetical protein